MYKTTIFTNLDIIVANRAQIAPKNAYNNGIKGCLLVSDQHSTLAAPTPINTAIGIE
jgi:hypothetical protein